MSMAALTLEAAPLVAARLTSHPGPSASSHSAHALVAPVRSKSSAIPSCSGLRVWSWGSTARSGAQTSRGAQRAYSGGAIVAEVQETVTGAGVVSDKTFKTLVLESDIPVLVDFWAPWCGPCRMIAPLIDELARTYAGRIKCLKLNTDESPLVATEYGIRSIPTVMIFKDGEKVDTVIGAVPKTTLTTTIDKYLNR